MSPLEKMARAICSVEGNNDAEWPEYIDAARAALLAIREPDREVTRTMDAESYPDSGSYTRWQAGIDAILNQEPRP